MLHRIFFETKMTWKRVIILSILCGIIPGLLMVPKILEHTSFRQPGISFEFWIVMAMYIILNCDTPLEAGKKTLIFFLISQPLIYLVQVPYSWLHWNIFIFYPTWGILTLFTFPGGMLAWYTKQNKWYSILIWMVASALLCIHLVDFTNSLFHQFPRLLISSLFTLSAIVLFPYLLFEKKSYKWITYLFTVLSFILVFQAYHRPQENKSGIYYELEEVGPFTLVECDEAFEVEFQGQNLMINYNINVMNDQQYYEITYLDGNQEQHHHIYQYQKDCLILIKEE